MDTRRNKEIKAVVAALTVAAAVASGILTVRDAEAAPAGKKKSTVTVRRAKSAKPVYVKMSGSRRAAENRARQLYADALAQKAADEQALIDARLAAEESNAAAAVTANNTTPNPITSVYGVDGQVVYPGVGGFGPAVVTGGYGQGGYGYGGVGSFTFPQFNNTGYSGNVGYLGGGGFVSPNFGGFNVLNGGVGTGLPFGF